MAYLTITDLSTNIYSEIINQIIRNDTTIADKAINAAISQVKAYLSVYNLVALFGTTDTQGDYTNPTYEDEYLKSIVKDVACWNILKLSNPNVDMTLFRTAYEDAISFLTNIQKGLVSPGYPVVDDGTENDPNDQGGVSWESNHKRHNHY